MWNPLDGLANVTVYFRKLDPDAKIPSYESAEAAGADICSIERVVLAPRSRTMVPVRTGIGIQLPKGFEAQCRPRSGLALKHGITVLNAPGTIDSDYRGEIGVILHNTAHTTFTVNPGDRIAQLVIVPVFRADFAEVGQLGQSARGERGYGSTGIQTAATL